RRGTCAGASSLDYLVGSNQYGLRDRDSQRLGGLQIDQQVALGGLPDGKVGGFSALQDLVHEGSHTPEHVKTVRPVAHKAVCGLHTSTYCRQPALCSEVQDSFLVGDCEGVPKKEQGISAFPGYRIECRYELIRGSHVQRLKGQAQRPRQTLRLFHAEDNCYIGSIGENGHTGDLGDNLLEEMQLLPDYVWDQGAQPSDVPARTGKAGEEPSSNRAPLVAMTMGIVLVASLTARVAASP